MPCRRIDGRHGQPVPCAIGAEGGSVIEREEVIRLSPRDWNWLLDLMENPPKPNAKLKAALKRYQKAKRDDAGTSFRWEP